MPFSDFYRMGKGFGAAVIIFSMIGFLWFMDNCYDGGVKPGDTVSCYHLTAPVEMGTTLDDSIVEIRKVTVDSAKFDCVGSWNWKRLKGKQFARKLPADTMILKTQLLE